MLVKVWNENKFPYREEFRDRVIEIPAKGFIEMEYDEAMLFRGSFSPIQRDGDGQPLPTSFKMIRVEEPPVADSAKSASALEFLCQKCRYLGENKADLLNHLAIHKDDVLVDESAERELARKKSKAS